MEPIKEKVKNFNVVWKQLETIIHESFIQILNLEIANKTPEELLQKVVETMESKSRNHNIYCQEQVILLKAPWKFKAFHGGLGSKTFSIFRVDV